MILDGTDLARRRLPGLRERAGQVARDRGRPPSLALIAFATADGPAPHIAHKIAACRAAGVETRPLTLTGQAGTGAIIAALDSLDAAVVDGVFLQFPFPAGVAEDRACAAIAEALDVDVMSPARIRRYLAGPDARPPVTVSALLELLDAYDVAIGGRCGTIVGFESDFTRMMRTALERRGASMRPLLPPDTPDLERELDPADLVVVAAARPGLLAASRIPAGAIAIDVGYFNPGGLGDIRVDRAGHLAALSPVPGGIGPMTVSCLIERVILYAEGDRR